SFICRSFSTRAAAAFSSASFFSRASSATVFGFSISSTAFSADWSNMRTAIAPAARSRSRSGSLLGFPSPTDRGCDGDCDWAADAWDGADDGDDDGDCDDAGALTVWKLRDERVCDAGDPEPSCASACALRIDARTVAAVTPATTAFFVSTPVMARASAD